MRKNILYLTLKLPPVKLLIAVVVCSVYGCVDTLPYIEDGPDPLICDTQDTSVVELINGYLALPCENNECIMDNYYSSIAILFPSNSIYDVLNETFWGSWGSEFHWDTELLEGKTCIDPNNQSLQLCLTDTNFAMIFAYADIMVEVPAYKKPDIRPQDCKHTMTLRYYSHYDDKCIIWTKVWMPGVGDFYSDCEQYKVCFDSSEPLIGQAAGRGSRQNVYIYDRFEEVLL